MQCDERGEVCVCRECDRVFVSPYWSARKTAGLHERGTGHKVKVVKAYTLLTPKKTSREVWW